MNVQCSFVSYLIGYITNVQYLSHYLKTSVLSVKCLTKHTLQMAIHNELYTKLLYTLLQKYSVAKNWHPEFSHHHSVLHDRKEHRNWDLSYSSFPSATTVFAPSRCFCSIKPLLWPSLTVCPILISSASIYYVWLVVSSLENTSITKRNAAWSDS